VIEIVRQRARGIVERRDLPGRERKGSIEDQIFPGNGLAVCGNRILPARPVLGGEIVKPAAVGDRARHCRTPAVGAVVLRPPEDVKKMVKVQPESVMEGKERARGLIGGLRHRQPRPKRAARRVK
jgi:hypothetical protein